MGGIGKAISKVTDVVGKVADTVSKVAGGIAEIGGKAMEFLNKPLSELAAPVASFVGKQVEKLPFVGKFLGPIAENLVKEGASAFLGEATLGSIGFLSKVAPKIQDVVDIATKVKKAADDVGALADNPTGLQNWQNLMAHAQARFVE